ncbi:MAG: hypothetical protein AAF927_32310 [Bacteroidota bacterium]
MIGFIMMLLAGIALMILVIKKANKKLYLSNKFLAIGLLLACSSYFIFYLTIVSICDPNTSPSYCEQQGQYYGLRLALPIGLALFGGISLIANRKKAKEMMAED